MDTAVGLVETMIVTLVLVLSSALVSEHYTIGYYPANGAYDGKWRKLRVTATDSTPAHATYIARTRTGYYAKEANGASRLR